MDGVIKGVSHDVAHKDTEPATVATSLPRLAKKKAKLNALFMGESLDSCLDIKSLERDCNLNVHMVETHTMSQNDILPAILHNSDTDVLILQAGSSAITDIEVNNALKDTEKDLEAYKKEWFHIAEQDSVQILDTALNAARSKPEMKVVISKRVPRYDTSSSDLLGIKTQLSSFANTSLDQLWIKAGSPKEISIIEPNLNTNLYPSLKSIICGSSLTNSHYDGVRMLGAGAKRHYTYRIKQALTSELPETIVKNQKTFAKVARGQKNLQGKASNSMPSKLDREWTQVHEHRRRNFYSDVSENMPQFVQTSHLPLNNRFSVLGNF